MLTRDITANEIASTKQGLHQLSKSEQKIVRTCRIRPGLSCYRLYITIISVTFKDTSRQCSRQLIPDFSMIHLSKYLNRIMLFSSQSNHTKVSNIV